MSLSVDEDGGYATPMALVFSLAFALIGSAMLAQSVMMLRLTKSDLERSREAYALDGSHLAAAAAVVRSGLPGPYHWTFANDLGWVEATAEPEGEKLVSGSANRLDDAWLTELGVQDPAALKLRLANATRATGAAVGALDPAPLWRDCGPAMVSVFGEQSDFTYKAGVAPGPGQMAQSWHVGEVWRIRITSAAGWRDDRIVRFTGSAQHPAATVTRTFSKGFTGGDACPKLLEEFAAN